MDAFPTEICALIVGYLPLDKVNILARSCRRFAATVQPHVATWFADVLKQLRVSIGDPNALTQEVIRVCHIGNVVRAEACPTVIVILTKAGVFALRD